MLVIVNEITVAPDVTPVTAPDIGSTVAMPVFALPQVPPASGSVNVVVAPVHIVPVPEIGEGNAFTLTILVIYVTEQPEPLPLFTVTVYIPSAAAVAPLILGFCSVEEKPDGPDHE